MGNFWKAFGAGMYMLGWFQRASLDGKISQDELVEGVSGLIEHLGVDITIDVPTPPGAGGAVPR